ncbi:VRR-NUC domain-containing protein [Paenibacillus lentus]|uniref:VRR-NUC domain-containing protein n=1 Tax=Paenibacillus lentus TaxID=1338368 RepID=A0A3S8RP64_9BACL|nr:VRR-NUC domain-containing protein [Paenibacillus lentus]AZK44795.1 VRR-NUC domain-containing protein [Paenibacillus lentus]
MASEKLFEKKVEKHLHAIGVYQAGTPSHRMETDQIGWFTKIWGGGYQKSGIPDLLCCVNGFFVSVELKASKGRPSDLQKMNTARINRSNGIGIVLYPEGFENFKELMKKVITCKHHIQELNSMKDVHSGTGCDILMTY